MYTIFFYFFGGVILFLFGTALGSFLNVVIYRGIRSKSWVKGRSRCEFCRQQIIWRDNIPLLSFLLLKGRCRACQKKISFLHPLVELATGGLFLAWWVWFLSAQLLGVALYQSLFGILLAVFWLIVFLLLWWIFLADVLYLIIPDFALIPLFILALAYRVLALALEPSQLNNFIWTIVLTAILIATFFALWYFTKGKGFGFGDVKLIAPLALLMAFPDLLVGVFFAFILASIVAIIFLITGRKKFGQVMPFGPFLVLGTVIALIWGSNIWQWYLSLMI